MLRVWDDGPARVAGAAEYQLARNAIQAGDHAAALQHLEQAILAHPSLAVTAAQDPEFAADREPLRDLVGQLSVVARMRAEASMTDAGGALESVHASRATAPMRQAQAYLDMAQAQFELASYAGYVQAAQAAAFAQQIAARHNVVATSKPVPKTKANDSVSRALWRATRRLWRTLPLLAILLGWLFAGILGGIASLPFREGSIAELRHTLFPVWAMGLLGMVVLGFLRSIRRIGRRRAR